MYIQILGLRPYINKEGKEVLAHRFYKKNWRVKSVTGLFQNLDEVLSWIPQEERYNLYYTAANCNESEKPRDFAFQNIIPFDIDGINTDRIEEYIDLICETLKIERQETGIVATGNGLQLIIGLEQGFDDLKYFSEMKLYYKGCCTLIDNAMKAAKLPGNADPVVFSKGRILRLPGTQNIKKDKGTKQATLINAFIVPRYFDLRLAATGVKAENEIGVKELKAWGKIDHEEVEKECDFLKWCKDNPNSVGEPEWYAMLSIVGRFEDGQARAHEYSEDHDAYDEAATQAKFEQATTASGPRTCEGVNEFWDGCKSCKHFGSITSPVLLRGASFIKTSETKFHQRIVKPDGTIGYGKPMFEDLRRHFEKKYKYKTTEANWVYVWKDTHWELLQDSLIEAYAQEHFEDLTMNTKVSEFLKFIHRTNKVNSEFFGGRSGVMNFKNGMLDLKTKDFMEHKPEYGFTTTLDYEYDPKALCPSFDKFMEAITCNRKGLENILLEFAGYSFSSMEYRWHKCLIMEGEGSNGKSTFIEILCELAGVEAYSNLLLTDLSNDAKLFLMMNKLFNIAEETPRKGLLDSSVFKIITSGGRYQVKQLYKQPQMVMENRTKLIMACNELPNNFDSSNGFFRRLIIVPFEQKFVEGVNADVHILTKLKKELPGILNRIIEGYDRLIMQNGFTKADEVDNAISDYKRATDTVSEWFYDHAEVTGRIDDKLVTNELFLRYVDWCEKYKCKFKSKNIFAKEVALIIGKKPKQMKINNKNVRGFEGARLKISESFI